MPEYKGLVIKVKTEGDVQAAAKKLSEATGKLGGIEINKNIEGLGTHLKALGKVSGGLIESITKGALLQHAPIHSVAMRPKADLLFAHDPEPT